MTVPVAMGNWRDYGPANLPRVLDAALERFVKQGYHGASIRDLALEAGLSVPGLYHHYRSKQDILLALMTAVMDELLERSKAALDSAGDDPATQFEAVVESLLRFHMFRRREAFVASSEIRSLDPSNRKRYVERRDEQQRMLDRIVMAGTRAGVFSTPYPEDAARAVASLCVGVAAWYREDGPHTPNELVRRHLALARGLIGA